jgi:chromosome segregation ATPase
MLARQENEIETTRDALDQVRTRLDSMAARLCELSAGQEALELQTALLSSDAEGEFPGVAASSVVSGDAAASIKALEQLQSQLNELTRTLEVSAAQTEGRVGTLEGRIQDLQRVADGLERVVSDLREEIASVGSTGGDSKKPEVPTSDDPTEDAWRTMVEDVRSLETLRGVVEERLELLEKQRETLQESLKALSLQQVRTDHDIRQLRKQSKQLAGLAAAGGVLAGVTIAWLLSGV